MDNHVPTHNEHFTNSPKDFDFLSIHCLDDKNFFDEVTIYVIPAFASIKIIKYNIATKIIIISCMYD